MRSDKDGSGVDLEISDDAITDWARIVRIQTQVVKTTHVEPMHAIIVAFEVLTKLLLTNLAHQLHTLILSTHEEVLSIGLGRFGQAILIGLLFLLLLL